MGLQEEQEGRQLSRRCSSSGMALVPERHVLAEEFWALETVHLPEVCALKQNLNGDIRGEADRCP